MFILKNLTLTNLCLVVLFFFVCLTVFLLKRQKEDHQFYTDFIKETARDRVEASIVTSEEQMLSMLMDDKRGIRFVSQGVARDIGTPLIGFVLLMAPLNCSNSLDFDVKTLNTLHQSIQRFTVQGYYVSKELDRYDEFIGGHDFKFPVKAINPWKEVDDSTMVSSTPLVVVLDMQHNAILDVHRPIPDDVEKSALFYDRWSRIAALVYQKRGEQIETR